MAKHTSGNGEPDDPEERDAVASLLQHAGKRAAPPPDMVERVRVQVHAVWREEVARRRRNRLLAVAASLLTLTVGGWWATQLRNEQSPVIVASIERGATDLRIRSASDTGDSAILPSAVGATIAVGDRVESGPAGVVLRVSGAGSSLASLRLAPDTSLAWQTPDRVRLLRGQLYLDTGTAAASSGPVLAIEAGGALIEHVGTRFLAALSGTQLDVKVRDGAVRIERTGEVAVLQQGEHGRLYTDASDGAHVERLRVGSAGDDWSWVDALAPHQPIDNQSVLTVMRRIAHEGGLVLRFESAEVEREAATAVLHGPALEMAPRQALDAILVTTAYVAVPEGDGSHLLVRRR